MPPQRRGVPRMGVRVQIDKVFMRHRKWTKSYGCSVPGCKCADIEFAHVTNAANRGLQTKPHDAFGYPLCRVHHAEAHRGEETFERKYGISRYQQAAWFMLRSPDTAMRDSFYQLPEHVQRLLLEAA